MIFFGFPWCIMASLNFIYLIRYALGGLGFFLGVFFIHCTYDIVQLHIYLSRHIFHIFHIFFVPFSYVHGFGVGRVDAYYNG